MTSGQMESDKEIPKEYKNVSQPQNNWVGSDDMLSFFNFFFLDIEFTN